MPEARSQHSIALWVADIRAATDGESGLRAAKPLLDAAQTNAAAAIAAVSSLDAFSPDDRIAVAKTLDAWPAEPAVLIGLADAFELLTDIDDLNAPPPSDPWFAGVIERLVAHRATLQDREATLVLDRVLASAARRLGRAGDSLAEAAHQRVLASFPDDAGAHYSHGLFLKTRGRFADGQRENEMARRLGSTSQATLWNLGICATGAGDGGAALEVWKGLGHHVELGRFDLPDGGFPAAKVRLAQRPLAERSAADDDPGLEENVYAERLSACHGIVRCALFEEDIGVEYGDVVLFDGAPVGRQGDGSPIYPHLATLQRSGYRTYWFGGTQPRAGAVSELSFALPGDAVVYVLTEQMVFLCAECARGRGKGSKHAHTHEKAEHRRVRGKICASPEVDPRGLLDYLDRAMAASPGTRVLSPSLVEEAGFNDRAVAEDAELEKLFE